MSVLKDLFGPGTWGTGGNLVAWALCGVVAGVFGYIFRDRIGRRLAAWWHKHHGGHLRGELAAMEERLRAHVSAVAADGPVSGGPGSNPGPEGLPADGPVVPPPAAAPRRKVGGYTGGKPASEVGPPSALPSNAFRRERGERM